MSPWRELFHKPRIWSCEHAESSGGMLPSKVFMLRLRSRSPLRRPSSDGMPPLKLLFDSCSLVREVRLAMQGGMEPEMPSDWRSSAITRRGDTMLQVIPCHSQTSRDVLLHEAKTPAGPESQDLKQRRDCLSFSVSPQVANVRQQKKAKRHRNQTKPGNKTPEDAIVIVCRSMWMKALICKRMFKHSTMERDSS
uniref:Uncharacterized protein n=1 Tax=Triticum urartu TaxID=4572 RepID=A0A8R7R1T5_TRIUA